MNMKYIIVGILCVLLVILGSWVMQRENNIYEYGVDVGVADGYLALLDRTNNYFTDQNGKKLLGFTSFGGSPMTAWGGGEQATAMGIKAPLPYGVKVRWFSIAENQFWEGEAVLNQEKLEQLKHYKIKDIFYSRHDRLLDYSVFSVDYAPGGLVTIWIGGSSEQYLVAQFRAKKVEEPNWDLFIQGALGEKISYKDYLAYLKKKADGPALLNDKIQKEILEKKVSGADPWLRLMNQYSWFLKANDLYELKGYFTNYLNGEQYFTYSNQDQTKIIRAIPFNIAVLLKSCKTKETIFLDFDFNKEEIMEAFEKLSKEQQGSEPIQLYLEINDNISEVSIFLMKGTEKIELEKVKITRKDVPE